MHKHHMEPAAVEISTRVDWSSVALEKDGVIVTPHYPSQARKWGWTFSLRYGVYYIDVPPDIAYTDFATFQRSFRGVCG